MEQLNYNLQSTWEGNTGLGTKFYRKYGRNFIVHIDGGKCIHGSADPKFLGSEDRLNPEELLLSAVSGCHMMTYLALASQNKVIVTDYQDNANAVLQLYQEGGGRFTEINLEPVIVITDENRMDVAYELHTKAHEYCFIASSLNVKVNIQPKIILNSKEGLNV